MDDVAERFHGARLQLGHCASRGAALLQCSVHLQPAFPSRCHVPGMFHQQLKTRQERAAALHCKQSGVRLWRRGEANSVSCSLNATEIAEKKTLEVWIVKGVWITKMLKTVSASFS